MEILKRSIDSTMARDKLKACYASVKSTKIVHTQSDLESMLKNNAGQNGNENVLSENNGAL